MADDLVVVGDGDAVVLPLLDLGVVVILDIIVEGLNESELNLLGGYRFHYMELCQRVLASAEGTFKFNRKWSGAIANNNVSSTCVWLSSDTAQKVLRLRACCGGTSPVPLSTHHAEQQQH